MGGSIGILVLVAYGQLLVIRWFTGLNDNPVYHVTYQLPIEPSKVKEAVLNPRFLSAHRFKVLVKDKPELVLKRGIFWNPRIDNILIICPSEHNTLVHGSAFVEDLYAIRETDYATERLDRVINELVGGLNVVKGEPFIDERLKAIAQGFVEFHTRTKFTVAKGKIQRSIDTLERLVGRYQASLGFIASMWLLFNVLFFLLQRVNIPLPLNLSDLNAIFAGSFVFDLVVSSIISEKTRGV
jgi:hypothetical protein